jgi:hypothetical protein
MHYAKMFDNQYVGAWDLTDDEDRPVDKTVTIEKVEKQKIKSQRGEETKPVLYFAGTPKGMIVNKTNARTIAGMYGNNVNDWIGKRVTLYQAMTSTPDGEKPCIRVRPVAPSSAKERK